MTPQLQNALRKARNDLRETAPLIHCITNPIAINDCANGILAVGGKPIMAEHPDEVEEITCIAGALGVNIGNITDARRTSVLTSAKAAKTAGVPVSFDAVGVTCSALRRDLTHTLLREACPEILKGNDAEIRAIAGAHFESRGIDVLRTNTAETIEIAKMLASTLHCVVLVTGKTDIITNGETTVLCENGTPRLSLVTGTGCMVHALCASYSAVTDPFTAAVLSVSTMGICGELSERKSEGLGSFRIALLDALSLLSDDDYTRLLKLREV